MLFCNNSKKIICAFQNAGAVNKEHAVTLDHLKLSQTAHVDKMIKRQIIIPCETDKFYLNTAVLDIYKSTRNHFIRIIVIILILFLLAVILGILTR
ncbi:MAG: hypothetical protein NT175_11940 [Bacteroidetes bacterium]|nr:hypothetical protein [Bacteroidota bacterium]